MNAWTGRRGHTVLLLVCQAPLPHFILQFFLSKAPQPYYLLIPSSFSLSFYTLLPVYLQAVCRSCLCRALRWIKTLQFTKSAFFSKFNAFLSILLKLKCFQGNYTQVVCSSSLVSCTGFSLQSFFSWQTTPGWLGRAQNTASECAEAETVCPDRATGAETAAYIIP